MRGASRNINVTTGTNGSELITPTETISKTLISAASWSTNGTGAGDTTINILDGGSSVVASFSQSFGTNRGATALVAVVIDDISTSGETFTTTTTGSNLGGMANLTFQVFE